mmetsp:Transcript_881/g.2480  ORF Transcript_881/g.2480 Transcript_881/m.2480 type:complete len:266 (+) Transcript_881:242-1039(+)
MVNSAAGSSSEEEEEGEERDARALKEEWLVFFPKKKRLFLELELFGDFPGEVGVGGAGAIAEVAVGGGFLVLGLEHVEFADEHAGAEVEVGLDDGQNVSVRFGAGAVGVDEDGEGFRDADGVGHLDEAAFGEFCGHDRFGDPAAVIGGGTVDFRRIFSGESAAAVGAPAPVGVDDDLATGEAAVALGPADGEHARGVDVVDGLVVEEMRRNDGLNDVLHQVLFDVVLRVRGVVLRADDNGVDAQRRQEAALLLVFDGDLGLAVRP